MTGHFVQGSIGRFSLALVGAGAVLAASGQALADHGRGRDRCDTGRSYVGYRSGWNDCGSRTSFSISIGSGWGDCGPRYSSWSYRYYDSCAPRYYCPPAVVYRPAPVVVYDPPVVVRQYPVYTAPVVVNEPVVVERPIVVQQQPVVVQQPVQQQVVQQQPVVVQQPAQAQPAVQAPPVVQQPVVVQQASQAEEGRYQDRELGDAYLRMADPENAARAYRRYLTAWGGDGTAARNYGFALVARGDVQEGFRNVVQGYRLENGLIRRPLRVQDLGGPVGFQRLLDAASRGADGTNTADGWLTVAILQNVAGQRDAAVNALQRARDAGLEQSLLDAFTLEFSRSNS
jgi:hypothetical protein